MGINDLQQHGDAMAECMISVKPQDVLADPVALNTQLGRRLAEGTFH